MSTPWGERSLRKTPALAKPEEKAPPPTQPPTYPKSNVRVRKPPTIAAEPPPEPPPAKTPAPVTTKTKTPPSAPPSTKAPPNAPPTVKAPPSAPPNAASAKAQPNGAPPPPPPPAAPPAPPPPPGRPPTGSSGKTPAQLAKVEQLRKGARMRRPDFGTLMKEIEQGKKLQHVQCNDRSKPIIPRLKSFAGKFVFDSEAKPATKKDAIHNVLLAEIQSGVKLKKVQCNDRSKPILAGLKKFRRQTTMEENADGKGSHEGSVMGDAAEDGALGMQVMDIDADFDIDALRDDLQSTKQMVELEIQAKTAIEKENRDLRCQIIAMEAENQNLKTQLGIVPEDLTQLARRDSFGMRRSRSGLYKSASGIKSSKSMKFAPDNENIGELNEYDEEIAGLKAQVQLMRKCADEWEIKCEELNQAMLVSKGKLEDSEQKRLTLEKKLELVVQKKGIAAVMTVDRMTQTTEHERKVSRQHSQNSQSIDLDGHEVSESEEESESDVDEESINKKKQQSELKLWENKLKSHKERNCACKRERIALKIQQKDLEKELKKCKQGFKELQKEVGKMAKMMKDETKEDDEDEDEEEESSEEEEEEEEESSEEEESEEEEEESSEEEEPMWEGATHESKMATLNVMVKREENKIGALKKGNFLLKANIDHLKDTLSEVREKNSDLEQELNTILADV